MSPLRGFALPAGGTIGIVAPGSPYAKYTDVLRGIAWWEARGYHVKLAKNALQRTNWTAGSPEQRASDLMEMFTDPEVDVIQCLRGGCGTAEVVPLLDFQTIARHPKPFLGFSDITDLHCAFQRFTGLATFYGPTLTLLDTSLAEDDFSARHMLQTLSGQAATAFPRSPADPFAYALAPGKASGRLAGGCLSNLVYTIGTPWEIDLDGAIFAFEEIGSSPHTIDRALLQLSQIGKLQQVRGVVIGDLTDCEWNGDGGSPWPHTKTLAEVLEDRLKPLGVPVVPLFPFGHDSYNATLPLGVQATLDAETCTLTIDEPALLLR